MSFFRETKVKAAKGHKCIECHGGIAPGEHYYQLAGHWDGEFWSGRLCLDCKELRKEVEQYYPQPHDEPICFGELHEFIREVRNDDTLGKRSQEIIARRREIWRPILVARKVARFAFVPSLPLL